MTRRRALAEASVELTPLIDVVLLLLIFFMVSASFIRESQLGIELPTASGQPRAMQSAALEVAVYRNGDYRVNGEPVDAGALSAHLAALVAAGQGTRPDELLLTIAADAGSTHQAVVLALEAAGRAGLTRISMLTHQGDGPAAPAVQPDAPGNSSSSSEKDGKPHAG